MLTALQLPAYALNIPFVDSIHVGMDDLQRNQQIIQESKENSTYSLSMYASKIAVTIPTAQVRYNAAGYYDIATSTFAAATGPELSVKIDESFTTSAYANLGYTKTDGSLDSFSAILGSYFTTPAFSAIVNLYAPFNYNAQTYKEQTWYALTGFDISMQKEYQLAPKRTLTCSAGLTTYYGTSIDRDLASFNSTLVFGFHGKNYKAARFTVEIGNDDQVRYSGGLSFGLPKSLKSFVPATLGKYTIPSIFSKATY